MEGGVVIIVLDESPQTNGVDVKTEMPIAKLTCHICGKGLKNEKTLKSHQIIHQNNPGYQCPKCLVVKIIKTIPKNFLTLSV